MLAKRAFDSVVLNSEVPVQADIKQEQLEKETLPVPRLIRTESVKEPPLRSNELPV